MESDKTMLFVERKILLLISDNIMKKNTFLGGSLNSPVNQINRIVNLIDNVHDNTISEMVKKIQNL